MIPIINTQNQVEFELSLQRKFLYSPSSRISLVSLFDIEIDDSLEVQMFIQDVYRKYYKAEIDVTYPTLMTILDGNHAMLAAVGFRFANDNALFLEQYLDDKIEDVLSAKYQKRITRSQIVEVGSLASIGGGMSKFLFIALAAYLRKMGGLYVVMVGTSKLRKSFGKLRLKPVKLCDAHKDRLIDKSKNWGSYYDSGPQVLAGDLDSGYKTLKLVLGASINSSITKLYPYE